MLFFIIWNGLSLLGVPKMLKTRLSIELSVDSHRKRVTKGMDYHFHIKNDFNSYHHWVDNSPNIPGYSISIALGYYYFFFS